MAALSVNSGGVDRDDSHVEGNGSNLTPIGSAPALVAVTIIHKNDLAMSFGRFVKLAIPFAALQIALATVDVRLVLR